MFIKKKKVLTTKYTYFTKSVLQKEIKCYVYTLALYIAYQKVADLCSENMFNKISSTFNTATVVNNSLKVQKSRFLRM